MNARERYLSHQAEMVMDDVYEATHRNERNLIMGWVNHNRQNMYAYAHCIHFSRLFRDKVNTATVTAALPIGGHCYPLTEDGYIVDPTYLQFLFDPSEDVPEKLILPQNTPLILVAKVGAQAQEVIKASGIDPKFHHLWEADRWKETN